MFTPFILPVVQITLEIIFLAKIFEKIAFFLLTVFVFFLIIDLELISTVVDKFPCWKLNK